MQDTFFKSGFLRWEPKLIKTLTQRQQVSSAANFSVMHASVYHLESQQWIPQSPL